MARCPDCGVQVGFFSNIHGDNLCNDCATKGGNLTPEEAKLVNSERNSQINAIMLTTETAPNLNITKRIEVITAECAFGMNIFKDLFAAVRDVVGGRSEAVQKTMRDSRQTVLYELKKEAY